MWLGVLRKVIPSRTDIVATFAAILLAAGSSSRFQDKNYKKPFAPLEDRAVWLHSAEKFLNRPDVKQTILVISPEDREENRAFIRQQLAELARAYRFERPR